MEEKLLKLFKQAKYEPNPDLAACVWRTIIAEDKSYTAKFKLWICAFIGFASLAGLVPVFQMLLSDLAHSGFYEYFSLIFSDGGSILSYWKELTLSLAESLPTMSIIFTLSLVFISLLSFRYVMKQISRNQFISFEPLSV
jgi:hypothetical protein